VPKIACPTLVITTDGSGLAGVEETTAWQRMIPHSELVVLSGNSYHAAASHPVECARATLAFIERRSARA
jgi:pimeloyl-ACP methyl ester carboxylesterase